MRESLGSSSPKRVQSTGRSVTDKKKPEVLKINSLNVTLTTTNLTRKELNSS